MNGSTPADDAIVLPDRLDIAAAPQLRERILASRGDLVLDASAVAMMTTPGLQVLMAARDHLNANGRTLGLRDPSSAFRACAATLGVPLDRLRSREVAA